MTTAYIEGAGSKLAEALVAFQADPPKVEKDSYNPAFKSNFTSLEELTNKALPALNDQGLAYTVTSEVTEKGMVIVGTLLHKSGERLSASFLVTDTNPQKIGSTFTYARRYLLAALTGIVVDADDDGNAASQPTATGRQLDKARSAPAPTPPATGQSELDKLNARIRKYIGTPQDETKKNAVNSLLGSDELKGKSPVDQRKAVVTQLGIPE